MHIRLATAFTLLVATATHVSAQPQPSAITEKMLNTTLNAICEDKDEDEVMECIDHTMDHRVFLATTTLQKACAPSLASLAPLIKARNGKAVAAIFDGAAKCYTGVVAPNRTTGFAPVAASLAAAASAAARHAATGQFTPARKAARP